MWASHCKTMERYCCSVAPTRANSSPASNSTIPSPGPSGRWEPLRRLGRGPQRTFSQCPIPAGCLPPADRTPIKILWPHQSSFLTPRCGQTSRIIRQVMSSG